MTDTPPFASIFEELCGPEGLSGASARRVFDAILAGEWTPAQIGGLLVALRLRGETPEVVSAAAGAMRQRMLSVPHSLPMVVDTCGTGGSLHRSTLNVSTGAAIIVAASGVPVAKHGNRAASSQSGSADVLEALGVNLAVPRERQSQLLQTQGITFLFAQAHHPAMKHAGPIRRELGVRTLFNVLGPLANPAGATHQLVGAASDAVRELMAGALSQLGVQRAWVVHSQDGMDEISPCAPTVVSVVADGRVERREVSPETFGLDPSPPGSIVGGDPAVNAAILRSVLAGEPHPARNAFLLNAAGCLCVCQGLSPQAAAHRAAEVVDAKLALRKLDDWAAATRQMAS